MLYLFKSEVLLTKKVILLILDGWGKSSNRNQSAIANAKTPFIDKLLDKYSSAELITFGNHVGLPSNQMGNSEVGHLNISAGRIVYQDLLKIDNSISDKTFRKNKHILNAIDYSKKKNKSIHLIGLLSDGGVHSHTSHLEELLSILSENSCEKVYLHLFTDGRDVDPKSGIKYIKNLEFFLKKTTGKIVSIIGRYYSMDRDLNFERTKKAYKLIVKGVGKKTNDFKKEIELSYEKNQTDEFLEPLFLGENNFLIKEEDVVISFNFRSDRMRQITRMLSQKNFSYEGSKPLNLHYLTMTNYDDSLKGIKILFEKENLVNTLGEVISKNGGKQLRVAETEKYPHVTYFFNGGRENPFKNEKRILCQSPSVATYDLKPEMNALEVRDTVVTSILKNKFDFICVNFANPDMVGHTGDFGAAIKACETVDHCTSKIVSEGMKKEYSIVIIADHGNCEKMKNSDGTPNTAHTTNPVPIILVEKEKRKIISGILANVAPTILEIMGIKKPDEMDQKSLLSN